MNASVSGPTFLKRPSLPTKPKAGLPDPTRLLENQRYQTRIGRTSHRSIEIIHRPSVVGEARHRPIEKSYISQFYAGSEWPRPYRTKQGEPSCPTSRTLPFFTRTAAMPSTRFIPRPPPPQFQASTAAKVVGTKRHRPRDIRCRLKTITRIRKRKETSDGNWSPHAFTRLHRKLI